MPRYGFHGGVTELKFVLLYTLRGVLWQPTREELTELAFIDDNMDYFQFCDALTSLVEGKQSLLTEDGRYGLTEEGTQNEVIIENDIPSALRRAIDKQIEPKNRAVQRESCISAETVIRGGRYYAFLTLTDGHLPIYTLELQAATQELSDDLCRNFREKAETLYRQIMQTL